MQISLEVGVFAAATALIAKLGPISLAAHQIAQNAASATYMVPLGIGLAAAVRVGQALGRRDIKAPSVTPGGLLSFSAGPSCLVPPWPS